MSFSHVIKPSLLSLLIVSTLCWLSPLVAWELWKGTGFVSVHWCPVCRWLGMLQHVCWVADWWSGKPTPQICAGMSGASLLPQHTVQPIVGTSLMSVETMNKWWMIRGFLMRYFLFSFTYFFSNNNQKHTFLKNDATYQWWHISLVYFYAIKQPSRKFIVIWLHWKFNQALVHA